MLASMLLSVSLMGQCASSQCSVARPFAVPQAPIVQYQTVLQRTETFYSGPAYIAPRRPLFYRFRGVFARPVLLP